MALTKRDLAEIGKLIAENNQVLDELFASKIDLENIQNKMIGKLTEFRSDIMNHIDSFVKEIKENREQRTIQAEQTIRNTRRIEKLEKKVFA